MSEVPEACELFVEVTLLDWGRVGARMQFVNELRPLLYKVWMEGYKNATE